jgi:hypothetical protein
MHFYSAQLMHFYSAVDTREVLAALGRKTTVRPGFLSKALEALFFGLPRGARTLIMTQVMKSMARGTTDSGPMPQGQ